MDLRATNFVCVAQKDFIAKKNDFQWAKSTNVPHASNLFQLPVREHEHNVTKFSRNPIQT